MTEETVDSPPQSPPAVPAEQLRIPDLPPTSADFDSFIGEIAAGTISPVEFPYRFRAKDGYARDSNGKYVDKGTDGTINGGFDTPSELSIKEKRTVTQEQAGAIKTLGERSARSRKFEQQAANFESYIGDILNGKISSAELPYRFRAKDGYARDSSEKYVDEDGKGNIRGGFDSPGNSSIKETRTLEGMPTQLLLAFAAKIETFRTKSKEFANLTSYLRDGLNGKISSAELPYRFRAKDGYARDSSEKYVDEDGKGNIRGGFDSPGNSSIRETRNLPNGGDQAIVTFIVNNSLSRKAKISSGSALGIAERVIRADESVAVVAQEVKAAELDETLAGDLVALANLNGKVNDQEVDSQIVTLFKTGDDEPLRKLINERRAKYADIADTSVARAEISQLETYIQIARRINVRGRFWQAIQDGGLDENAGLRILEQYDTLDEADRALSLDLGREAVSLRRDRLIVGTFEQLAKDTPDFTAASLLLAGAAKAADTLKDEAGLETIRELAETVYDGEVASYFGGLVKDLTIDRERVAEVVGRLETAPLRPAIAGVDYFAKFQEAKEQFLEITTKLEEFAFEKELVELRQRFPKDPDVQQVVKDILELPGETVEDSQLRQALLDELALTVGVQRGLDPGRFALLKEVEVEGVRAERKPGGPQIDLEEAIPERNVEAVRQLVDRFQKSLMPLFEALRGGDVGEAMMADYVSGEERGRFVQRVAKLQEQRDLTDIERAYLESVELLTVFNPHLIALAREAPELTSLYLERYFLAMDARIKEALVPDMYVPVVQIGLGPNGVAAAGELARVNPEASAQTLFIEGNLLPGGPFGIAKGPAWNLNSANSYGDSTNILPDLLSQDEAGISVRSYGSPLVSYPGERREGANTRNSSINVTVDYLLNPDNISITQYPTNEDLARVLQLQSAMLVDNAIFGTRLIKEEPVDDGQPGNKRLTLEFTTALGETITTTIRTDAVVLAGGLGEPNYGLNLEGSKAENILDGLNLGKDNFPLLTDTIGAFGVLSSPTEKPTAPKGSIVIYGAGNSADVLVEYLGRQFESGNSALQGITRIYVVSTAELSKRPRYAQINDLKSRNGQANFLEVVPVRVRDVEQLPNGKLRLIGEDGQPIQGGTNGGRAEIEADHVIAASGFRPMLDQVFASSLSTGESIDRRKGLGRITLPNNPGFSVADELQSDPDVIFVGTGSRADFQNPNKLGQLPDEAREALLRNGAENAVAIGFRTPDTRAAMRLKFTGRTFETKSELQVANAARTVEIASLPEDRQPLEVSLVPAEQLPATRRDVEADAGTLSALFLEALPRITLADEGVELSPSNPASNQSYRLQVTYTPTDGQFVISSPDIVGRGLLPAIQQAVADPFFQAYALKALRGRRVNRGLEINLAFNRGRLQYRDPGEREDKGRTYVEVL